MARLLGILQLLSLVLLGDSIKWALFNVPPWVKVGDSASLTCKFDLEGQNLYAVKWYKDGREIYRYVPAEKLTQQDFPMSGVHIDVSQSDKEVVRLKNVSLESTGRYKCEVLAESPKFMTLVKSGEMQVVDPPSGPPTVLGGRTEYEEGDLVNVTCITLPSVPPAQLKWYINGEEASHNFLYPHATESPMIYPSQPIAQYYPRQRYPSSHHDQNHHVQEQQESSDRSWFRSKRKANISGNENPTAYESQKNKSLNSQQSVGGEVTSSESQLVHSQIGTEIGDEKLNNSAEKDSHNKKTQKSMKAPIFLVSGYRMNYVNSRSINMKNVNSTVIPTNITLSRIQRDFNRFGKPHYDSDSSSDPVYGTNVQFSYDKVNRKYDSYPYSYSNPRPTVYEEPYMISEYNNEGYGAASGENPVRKNEDGRQSGLEPALVHSRHSVKVSLVFTARRWHFVRGNMTLRCEAQVSELYTGQEEHRARRKPTLRPALFGGRTSGCTRAALSTTTSFFIAIVVLRSLSYLSSNA